MHYSTAMAGQLFLVGGARTEEARIRGRRRFIFSLSEIPSDEWKIQFASACERTRDKRWVPPELWHDEIAIEILLDDRDRVHAYLSERVGEANQLVCSLRG